MGESFTRYTDQMDVGERGFGINIENKARESLWKGDKEGYQYPPRGIRLMDKPGKGTDCPENRNHPKGKACESHLVPRIPENWNTSRW